MKLKNVMTTAVVILILLNILFFVFEEFNLSSLFMNLIISAVLVYFAYTSLKNYPFQKFKWRKNIIIVAILGYAAFFSMVIGFPLSLYSVLQQDKSLTLLSAIIIAIFFLSALLFSVFGMYLANKKAFKMYLITIFIWIVIIGLTGLLMNAMQNTALLVLVFALAICLVLFIFIFPIIAIVAIAASKKRRSSRFH